MPKFAILLILIGTTTFLWSQTEAKPFLFLPSNFFTLTTRAPVTSDNSLSSAPLSNNLFQLPLNIIQRKLNFIANLLSNFISGGNFQIGLKFNTGISTQRLRTTTERSIDSITSFTTALSTSSAVFTNTSQLTESNTEGAASLSTTATSKEFLSVNPITETTLTNHSEAADQKHTTEKTTDNNFENFDSTTKTIFNITESTTDNAKAIISTENPDTTENYSLYVDSTSEGTVRNKQENSTEEPLHITNTERTENPVITITTTENGSLNVDSISEGTTTQEPLFTTITENDLANIVSTEGFVSETMESITQDPLSITTTVKNFRDSTPNRIMTLTTVAPITLKPTKNAQQPIITTSTENILEYVDSTTVSTKNYRSSVKTGFDGKVHNENAEVGTESVQSSDDGKNSGTVSSSAYKYRQQQTRDDVSKKNGYDYNRPRLDSENELFAEILSRRYLPVL